MNTNFKKEVQLFMIFDILGDTERTGPHLWKIHRFRLEDVKNHILDLLLITRILKKHLPTNLDYNKIYDYIICHDLPEAITGDITKFEGIPEEEIKKVTNIAIEYLSNKFTRPCSPPYTSLIFSSELCNPISNNCIIFAFNKKTIFSN